MEFKSQRMTCFADYYITLCFISRLSLSRNILKTRKLFVHLFFLFRFSYRFCWLKYNFLQWYAHIFALANCSPVSLIFRQLHSICDFMFSAVNRRWSDFILTQLHTRRVLRETSLLLLMFSSCVCSSWCNQESQNVKLCFSIELKTRKCVVRWDALLY